jgi:hypothetical protein
MTAIEPQLYICEWIRAERKSPEVLNAWECMVRALWLMSTREKINACKAQSLLQKAVSLENESAQAHSLLSIATTFRLHMGWVNRRDTVPLAADLAQKAIALNPYEPWAHAALGYALIWRHPEEAMAPCTRAITLNSNLATSHYYLALASAYAGTAIRFFHMRTWRNAWHKGICWLAPTPVQPTMCVPRAFSHAGVTMREQNLLDEQFLRRRAHRPRTAVWS